MVAAAALPGLARRDRGRRPEPDAHRRSSTSCAASAPASTVDRDRERRRRAARHDHGRRRSAPVASRSRRTKCPASSTSCRRSPRWRRTAARSSVRGAGELRVKESDRIAALVAGFRGAGHRRRRAPGRLHRARRRARPPAASADAQGDHRLAMAFAIAALGAPRRRRRIDGADVGRRSRIPDFFDDARAARRVKTDKVYLVGFMGAGKTTVARALARRLGWQRRGHRRADRAARAADGRRDLRQAGRAVLPRGRARGAAGAAARPPRRRRDRRRHVRRSREPRHDQSGRPVGLARRAARRADRARAGRRPAAARRRSRAVGTAVSAAPRPPTKQAHLRLDAGTRQRAGARRADHRPPGGLEASRRCVTSSSPTSTPTSKRSTPCLADARARTFDQVLVLGDLVGYGADPNAVDRPRPRARIRSAIVRGNHDKVALRPRAGRRLQRRRASAPRVDARRADARATATGSRALPQGPMIGRRPSSRSATASPFDEDAYIFDELDALRALQTRDAAAVPVRPHPLPGRRSSSTDGSFDGIGAGGRDGAASSSLRAG